MHRDHGYGPQGERLVDHVPCGSWDRVTFLGAMSVAGVLAPWGQIQAINGESFRGWIEQILIPKLRRGMVIVMDNLPAHKVSGVREAIESAGCRLVYLPPYSPDLNPIEQMFSQFKSYVKKACGRTVDEIYQAMREALKTIRPTHCLNYILNAGYKPATI